MQIPERQETSEIMQICTICWSFQILKGIMLSFLNNQFLKNKDWNFYAILLRLS